MFRRCFFIHICGTIRGNEVLIREEFCRFTRQPGGLFYEQIRSTEKKFFRFPASINEAAIIQKLSLVSIIGNAVLSGFKLFAGLSGHSSAMLSDAIHSLSDVLTTVIAWVGVKLSRKGADGSHPYGHERFECVASLILGLVLLATGIGVGKVGITNIISKEYEILAIPDTVALIAAVVPILGKETVYWYTRHYAKIINSAAFMADAWHHRSDAFSSIGSFIGIGGAMLGYPILDSVASVVICLFIVKVCWRSCNTTQLSYQWHSRDKSFCLMNV